MTMDTFSTTTGDSPTTKDEARKCNLADKNKEDNETTRDTKNDETMMDVEDSTKANASTVSKSNMTRVVTQVSISESEDDGTGGAGRSGDDDSSSTTNNKTTTATAEEDGTTGVDSSVGDKKREKEYKPHTTAVSKKKAKVAGTTKDGEAGLINEETKASDSTDREEPNAEGLLVEDENLKDVLNLNKLYDFMKQNKNAAMKLADKDLLLLIGYTGAGKTSTTKYLAGTKFEFDEDKDDYVEVKVPDGLEEFIRSDSSKSVTKAIHATEIKGPGGEPVTVCDTPGFGDTKGVEMEISNGLMITRSLKQASSVKPVLVVNGGELVSTARGGQLQKTLDIVITMFGRINDFSAFEYVFTSWETKKAGRIHKKLVKLLKDLESESDGILADSADKKESYIAILSDMVEKTKANIHVIDLEDEDGAPELLENILSNDRRVSSDAFVEFVSMDAKTKLKFQVTCMNTRLENALKISRMKSVQIILCELLELASAISLPELEAAVRSGKRKLKDCYEKIKSNAEEGVDLCNEEQDVKKYQKFILKLHEKLLVCSQVEDVYKTCLVAEDDDFSPFLDSALRNLLAPIKEKLESIKVSDLFNKTKTLEDSLTKCKHLYSTLGSLLGADDGQLDQHVSNINDKILSLLKVAASDLELERALTAKRIRSIYPSVLFLLDMNSFLVENKIELPGTSEIIDATNKVLSKSKIACDSQIHILTELGSGGASLLTQEHSTPEKESIDRLEGFCEKLGEDQVINARLILQALADVPSRFVDEIYQGAPPNPDVNNVLQTFDQSVSTLVEKVTLLIEDTAEKLFNGETAQFFKTEIEEESELSDAMDRINHFLKGEIETTESLTRTIGILNQLWSLATGKWEHFKFTSLKAQEARTSNTALEEKLATKKAEFCHASDDIGNFDWDNETSLDEPLLEALREIGFDLSKFGKGREFTINQLGRVFYYNFEALTEYMEAYDGNCYVDAKVNKDLSMWTDKQRKLYKDLMSGKENELEDVHIEALKSIGFNFTIKTRSDICWDANYEKLLAFKEANGHCRVPQSVKPLGRWVDNMRSAKRGTRPSRLNPDRIRRLNEIGFVWDARR